GETAPLYRANSVTRAVYLDAGTHEVLFRFRPWDFFLGVVVSGVAWAGASVAWLAYRRMQPALSLAKEPAEGEGA
ncbi:MAG: hypothetical protein ACK2UK_12315, partial [Candidatus Promineifilaceae bacterium]